MIPSVAKVAFNISLSNHLFKIFSTEEVTKLDRSKGLTPFKIRLLTKKNLSFQEGFSIKLYGMDSILLSQKSQIASKSLIYYPHLAASFLLNFAISLMFFWLSPPYITRYLPYSLVGVKDDNYLKCIFNPFLNKSKSLIMLRLNNDRT